MSASASHLETGWSDDDGDPAERGIRSKEAVFIEPSSRHRRDSAATDAEDDFHLKSLLAVEEMMKPKQDLWEAAGGYELAGMRTETSQGGSGQPQGTSGGYAPRGVRPQERSGRPQEPRGAELFVSSLSEEATESDLQELFGRFGRLQRVHILRDRQTRQSKGSAFVSYWSRQDAQRAIENLHGHGLDNLKLRVEWSKPNK